MGLDRFASQLRRHRSAVVLASLLTACAGVALLLDRPKGGILEWLGIPFVVVGGAAFTWCVWPTEPRLTALKPTLANRFLSWSTWDGRLVQLFPAFGVATVLADLLYNIFLSATPALQTEDAIALLARLRLLTRATADGGPSLKRVQPRAMGRAFFIKHRTSHLTIAVTDEANAPTRTPPPRRRTGPSGWSCRRSGSSTRR